MLLLEKIYRSFFLLVVFIVGGIYFLIQLAIMLWSNQIKAQELILYTGWVLLSIVYLIDRFNPNRSLEKVSCHFLMTAIRKTALYMLDL